jgi:hypothetical protein
MRRAIAVAAIVLAGTCGGTLAESQRDIVAKKYGDAMAAAEACQTLKFNSSRGSLYIVALGLKFDDKFQAIVKKQRAKALDGFRERSQMAVCQAGLFLYGPEGTEAPGLLEAE